MYLNVDHVPQDCSPKQTQGDRCVETRFHPADFSVSWEVLWQLPSSSCFVVSLLLKVTRVNGMKVGQDLWTSCFFQLDRGPWDYTFVVVFVRRFLHISAEQYNHIFLIAIMSEWPSSIVFNFTQLLICTSLTMNNNALSPCISGQWIVNLWLFNL